MQTDKYTHPLPMKMPIFLIILGASNLPVISFVYRIWADQDLWNLVLDKVHVPQEIILVIFVMIGIDMVLMFFGFWVLLHKEQKTD